MLEIVLVGILDSLIILLCNLFIVLFLIVFLFTNFDSKSHLAFDSLTSSCCESLDFYFHPVDGSVRYELCTILYTIARSFSKSHNTETPQAECDFGDSYLKYRRFLFRALPAPFFY